ncbi:MAG: hypothetical protein RL758_658 [Pseudomonadota bacterium]
MSAHFLGFYRQFRGASWAVWGALCAAIKNAAADGGKSLWASTQKCNRVGLRALLAGVTLVLSPQFAFAAPICGIVPYGPEMAKYINITFTYQCNNQRPAMSTRIKVGGQVLGTNMGLDSNAPGCTAGRVFVAQGQPFLFTFERTFNSGGIWQGMAGFPSAQLTNFDNCKYLYEDGGDFAIPEGYFTMDGTHTPVLSVKKTASHSTFTKQAAGQYYQLTITFTDGPTIESILIRDDLPAGVTTSGPITANGANAGKLSGCPGAGATSISSCTFDPGAVSPIVLTVPVNVGNEAASSITNTAAVWGGGDTDCNGTGKCLSAITTGVQGGSPATFTINQSVASNVTSSGPWGFSYSGDNGVGSPSLSNNSVGAGGAVNSPTYTLSALGTATTLNVPVSPGWYVGWASCTDTHAASTGNPTGNLATASGSTWGTYVLTIPAANVKSGSAFQCQIVYNASGVSVAVGMGGPRLNASDQFLLQVQSPQGAAQVSHTSAGSGSTVSPAGSGWKTFDWGTHTLVQSMASGSVSRMDQYTTSVGCTNFATGGSDVSGVKKLGDSFTSKDGDLIYCWAVNTPRATFTINQSVASNVTSSGPWGFSYSGDNGVGSPSLTNNSVGAGGAVNSPTYTLSALGTATTLNVPVSGGWYVGWASCTDTNAASTGNPTGNLATASGSTWGPYVLTIPAANVKSGSVFQCQLVYNLSGINLAIGLGGPRLNASDQFVLQVQSPQGATQMGFTSAGTGSTVSPEGTGWKTFDWGTHTLVQSMAAGSVSRMDQYTTSVGCTNFTPGGSDVSGVKKLGDSFTSKDADHIYCWAVNTPKATVTINQVINGGVSSPGPFVFSYTGTNGAGSPTLSNSAANWAGAIDSPTYTVLATGVDTVVTALLKPGWWSHYAACVDTNAASTGNPSGNLAQLSGNNRGPYVLTIPAANVKPGSAFRCQVHYSASGIRLITRLGGARINDADQFTAQVLSGGVADVGITSVGTGSAITGGGDSDWKTFGWGAHTIVQSMAAGSVSTLSQYTSTVSCSNLATTGSNVSGVTQLGSSFSSGDNDLITCTITNTPNGATLFVSQTLSPSDHRYPVRITYAANNGWVSRQLSSPSNDEVRGDVQSLAAVDVQMVFNLTVPNVMWRIDSVACTDSNAAISGNSRGSFGVVLGRTSFAIPATNVRANAQLQCATVMYAPRPF